MKNNSTLSFKDLNKMSRLLKTPYATFSVNGKLTELDLLAIKVIDDIQCYPTQGFFNLKISNNGNEKSYQPTNLENHSY